MKKYKYMRSDFQPLPVTLEHLDIYLSFLDAKVDGTNILRITANAPMDSIILQADELIIHSISWIEDNAEDLPLKYETNQDIKELKVQLPKIVAAGETFIIKTETSCSPTDNVLEGLYNDTTPEGCPQQIMSQCEHIGFERILPVFDDCTAKCTMRTTLEADANYTHLISNGNICKETNPDGIPILKPDDPTRKLITYENDIPMAPYLFIATVGTWDMLEDTVVYPSGRSIKLEYLVPLGKLDSAKLPMKILKDSILWQAKDQDYEYQRDVYRTITMEKSNFGGMENVGNTTIVTSAALIDEWTSDRRLEYAYGVIVHEWEHNQCGSDVTMETGFDMWLNEAFTVDVERRFVMSQFNPDVRRLDQVDSMRSPLSGPLAIEDGGHMGNIVREGYNNPDEVVDGVTYVKAAEVIRMFRLILGDDIFKKAKNLYFARYDGSNANTDQFLACFEEASGRDLSQFKSEWLFTIGYPRIEATYSYDDDSSQLDINFKQSRSGKGGLFHLPLELAAVDQNGNDIAGTNQTIEITDESTNLSFKDIPKPACVSFNRNCSFYGSFKDNTSRHNDYMNQIRYDNNQFNRVEAMRQVTDIERIKLINNINADIDEDWFNAYHLLLTDQSIPYGLKTYFLRVDEQSMNRDYIPYYRERYAARQKMLKALSSKFSSELLNLYNSIDTYTKSDDLRDGLEARHLNATILRIIIAADSPESHALAEDHFYKAWHITDRTSSLSCINLSNHPKRKTILSEALELWKDHLNPYSGYLMIISSGIHDDVFDAIAKEENRSIFSIHHPSHNRALYMPMCSNNKMIWTNQGINWVTDTVIKLAPINEVSTLHLVSSLRQVNNLADDLKSKVTLSLEKMLSNIDSKKCPAVAGRINAYLGN